MGDGVEADIAPGARVGGEPAVPVGQPGAALVEARELAGQVVERLALDGVGRARRDRRSSAPAAADARCGVEPSALGNSGATGYSITSAKILSPSSQAFIGWKT